MQGYPPGSIWPVSDHDNAQCREVYARYGLAMSQAQRLEHGMVNALMVFELMPSRRQYPDYASWEAAFDRFYDAELGRTYGNLLKRVAELPGLPSELLGRLSAAKTDRDHLAHRFFREHDCDFASAEGRTRMIAECEELIERFGQLDRELDEFSEPQRLKFGMTQEWIDQKADELMAYAILRERSVSEERPSDDGNSAT